MTKQNETVKSWEIDGIGQVSVTPHSAALSPYEPRLREIATTVILRGADVSATEAIEIALAVLRSELSRLLEAAGKCLDDNNWPDAWEEFTEELEKWKR